MASQRKTTSPTRTHASRGPSAHRKGSPARKASPAAKKASPRKATPAARPVKSAKPAAPAGRAAKKPAVQRPAPKKAVAPERPRKLKAVARPPAISTTVRPLGVLPPQARSRATERPAAVVPPPPRPSTVMIAKVAKRQRGPQRLTPDEIQDLEAKIREERAKLMKEMGHLESNVLKVNPRDSAGDLSGYSFHMADAGTDAYEREMGFQFASAEGRLLREFNEALRRLYAGEYGICESCGSAIAKARLLAVPTARLCRDCKEKEERENHSQQ